MKTSKEEIINTAVKMFARDGFEAVSMSMLAGALGITKGALYRHFESKQDIFDSIMDRMIALDGERAEEDRIPVDVDADSMEHCREMDLETFCTYAKKQFLFWTEDEFASDVRKMLTLEQYRNLELNKWYQDALCAGPVAYTAEVFKEMIRQGKLRQEAKDIGAENLAIQLFAPVHLLIQMSDGGTPKKELTKYLDAAMEDFQERWKV